MGANSINHRKLFLGKKGIYWSVLRVFLKGSSSSVRSSDSSHSPNSRGSCGISELPGLTIPHCLLGHGPWTVFWHQHRCMGIATTKNHVCCPMFVCIGFIRFPQVADLQHQVVEQWYLPSPLAGCPCHPYSTSEMGRSVVARFRLGNSEMNQVAFSKPWN